MQVLPFQNGFVAEISGIDLSQHIEAAQRDELVSHLDHYGVVVLHGQLLTNEQLVRLAQAFGPVATGLQEKLLHKVQMRIDDIAISDISNVDAAGSVADKLDKQAIMNVGNRFWHSDSSYETHPYRYSILTATTAVSRGGATEYADLRAAYDALDDDTKELIADKTATFYSHNVRQWLGIKDNPDDLRVFPPVKWPLVRVHPGSGRKVLWCDTKACEISGMSIPEGRALVHELVEHIGQRERVYAHYWRPGDVIIYDNRSVLHRGRRFDLNERREMRRVATLDDSSALCEASFDVAAPAGVIPATPAGYT
tara:strand:- start:2993 stop:3922 length:930 start_codon:yes stop_codon:yes gene_type:complete